MANDSIVLITGCSSGFGHLAALRFARAGHVVVATMRNPAKGDDLERVAKEEELHLEVTALDVTDDASVAAAVDDTIKRHGRLDVLVNNAGIGIHGAIEETPLGDVHALFDTNVYGALRVTQAVLPAMRAQGSGVIVNVSSIAGRVTAPFGGIYSATKFALEAISEALHLELGPFGIRVAVIEPGGFETRFDANRRRLDSSAYAELDAKWATQEQQIPGRDDDADPQAVADAIYEAATDPAFPLRRLVGSDAELIGQVRRDMNDRDFEHTMRTALDFWDGWRERAPF